MASEKYGVEGILVSPGHWRGSSMAANWSIYFTDETRYPIMIGDLHQTRGGYTTWFIEVYDNHGQHYLNVVQQSGCGQPAISHYPRDGVFRCVADKAFDKPLRPELINLVKSNNVQICIKAMDAVMMNEAKTTSELAATKAEVEALKNELTTARADMETLKTELDAAKTELDAAKTELDAAKTELAAAKATKTEKTNTTLMMASALAMGILGLVAKASHGENYSQTVMPPSWPQLPSVGDLD